MFLARKRYTIQKYIFVLLIVAGVIMFVYKDDKSKSKSLPASSGNATEPAAELITTTLATITSEITTVISTTIKPIVAEKSNSHLGLLLVCMSLLADGVLGAVEDRMRAATKPTALNFMVSINMFSAIILFLPAAVIEGQKVYAFALEHPDVLYKIGLAAGVGSLGQIFIFMMISDFGPLPCSIVTTTRKLFTVIISVMFMGNPLIARQWIATVIVFGALFADALIGKKHLCGPNIDQEVKPVPVEDPDVEKSVPKVLEADEVELEKLNGK